MKGDWLEDGMTRQEIQKFLIEDFKKEIAENGENAVFCAAPQPGKNIWTLKEALESIEADIEMENSGMNIITSVIEYQQYRKEHNL